MTFTAAFASFMAADRNSPPKSTSERAGAATDATFEASAPEVSGMGSDPDAGLVFAIGRGDQKAARTLADRHLARIVALARRMLNDGAEAEDVAQDVFLRVWRTAHKWRPGRARFETWMHRVAMNLCFDRLRRKREMVTDAPPDQPDPAASAFDVLHAETIADAVNTALAALPERQRAAITLCHYQDLTNIAAADVLDISVEALESLLARGRRALRAALAGDRIALLERSHDARG